MRDELWFIEFGRGVALPLTPEEAPIDGETVLPCAQGRIVVETTHPAPPHFATCLIYRHTITTGQQQLSRSTVDPSLGSHNQSNSHGAIAKALLYHRQHSIVPQSPATRPEDLRVTPWYNDDSLTDLSVSGLCDESSYPSLSHYRNDKQLSMKTDFNLTAVSEAGSYNCPTVQRKAYMDLTDAIALLDETCPNPNASPSLTPKTPLTPHPQNKRARSKSSDNSSNYSNEQLNDGTIDCGKEREKSRRPFLRKIGISKTEDRPFLAKFTPKIIGKPYLEKIGPSKAIEKPFLDKIGSSKTLEKFSFDTLRDLPKAIIKRTHTFMEPTSNESVHHDISKKEVFTNDINVERQCSGNNYKGPLLKMYSFETEDLDEIPTVTVKTHRDPLRGVSLDDVISEGSSSLSHTLGSVIDPPSNPKLENVFISDVELVKCRVTTSEEIVSSSTGYLESPRAAASWSNSPRWPVRRPPVIYKTLEREFSSREILISDEESVPNSPTKRRISRVSPEIQIPLRINPTNTNISSLRRDLLSSPIKTARRLSQEPIKNITSKIIQIHDTTGSVELMSSNSPRQTLFNQTDVDGFGRTTKRQVSEEILDKSQDQINANYSRYNEQRRGISSDNLRYSRETVVCSAPSASSLGYQSGGDSSFTSQRSSNNSQDISRGTFKVLHDKFELRDVPAESYAAYKWRARSAETHTTHEQYKFIAKETTIGPTIQMGKIYDIKNNKGNQNKHDGKKDNSINTQKINTNEQIKNPGTTKSILQKQDKVDNTNDQEADMASSLRRSVRKIFNVPSQETMDLLTELRKVKSLLKTPSEEVKEWELDYLKPARLPKKISLSDKEFCLSIDRENSIRRSLATKIDETEKNIKIDKSIKKIIVNDNLTFGPALFEKRCLSLDYADDVKPDKPEIRAISLASPGTPRSNTEQTIDLSDNCIIYDSENYLTDVFTSPNDDTTISSIKVPTKSDNQHCQDIDIAIPIDQKESVSPRRRIHIQGRTSDLYEIISPRLTPFRAKKRLGRISVEETVKQESFAIDKVDCRTVVTQKKTKCFPL